MFEWVWTHVVLPALGGLIEHVPWWGWCIVVGVLCALAWKVYKLLGWPGVIGIALAVLTFGAYRQGWLNAVQRHGADKFTPPEKKAAPGYRKTIFNPSGTKKLKRKYNADLNMWE